MSSIVEKVKKLLLLAQNNPNEHEANAAAARAAALIAEYNLEHIQNISDDFTFSYDDTGEEDFPLWYYYVVLGVQEMYTVRCRIIQEVGNNRVQWYGTEASIDAAIATFNFTTTYIKMKAETARREHRGKKKWFQDYCYGAAQRFWEDTKQQFRQATTEESYALVRDNSARLESYLTDMELRYWQPRWGGHRSVGQGYDYGKQCNVSGGGRLTGAQRAIGSGK